MKDIISIFIFATTLEIFILYAKSYNFKCPEQAGWKFRAIENCNSTMKYFCLYNNVNRKYVEGCTGPDWDRKGSKRIYAGDFTREKCMQKRFQPFKFWTNESTSDCIYAKSICSEEGQLIFNDNSTKDDRTCRCNYKRNYSFVATPRNVCFCIPTEEDCSCHIKSCPVNSILSADYECIRKDFLESSKCINLTRYYETLDENTGIITDKDHLFSEKTIQIKERVSVGAIMILCLCSAFVIVGFFFAALFPKWTSNNFKLLTGNNCRRHTENGTLKETKERADAEHISKYHRNETSKETKEGVDVEVHQPKHFGSCTLSAKKQRADEDTNQPRKGEKGYSKVIKERVDSDVHHLKKLFLDETCFVPKEMNSVATVDGENHKSCSRTSLDKNQTEQTANKVNYLRMVHLLFRVVCPVVRMYFNHEIEPKQLRKILDKNHLKLKKLYRQNDSIINDAQWRLLFRNNQDKTVTSDDFDVRLMIYLLKTITSIKLGNLYPTEVDTSTGAMLSRIKFIRNETIHSIDEKFSEATFNKYWDDMGQAVLKLVSPQIPHNVDDKGRTQLIERLLSLNPINIDIEKLCTFILMSEIYPAMLLRQFIFEYCASEDMTIEKLLKQETHQLYHKRQKTETCCFCEDDKYATYIKLLPEKQWVQLYEVNECTYERSCQCKNKICSKVVVPKRDLKLDLAVLVSLVLYIPEVLEYFTSHFSDKKFEKMLNNDQHTIYHYMEKERCCKCDKDPTEKTILNEKDWNTLFKKSEIACHSGKGEHCCCQYTVRNGIKKSSMDTILRSKIFDIAGPLGVINIIEKDSLSYFLNWTVHDRSLLKLLADLRSSISTEELHFDKLLKDTQFTCLFKLDKLSTKRIDAENWFATHIRKHTSTLEPPLSILVRDKEFWKVKSIQIPADFNLTKRARKFDDITPDENNFLVVVHTLKTIVHPVIKMQLDSKCSHNKLQLPQILQEIYHRSHNEGTGSNADTKRRGCQRLYLSEQQRAKLFSPTNDNSEMDLKTMLYILTQRTKDIVSADQNEWKEQLEVINKIRRDIMQSNSGILELRRFKYVMNSISKAVLLLGGERYKAELSQLSNNTNIFAAVRNAKQQHSDVSASSKTRITDRSSGTSITTVISTTSIPTPVDNVASLNSTPLIIPTGVH